MNNFDELLKSKNKYKLFLSWLLKQQYYILNPNIKKMIKRLLESESE